MLELNKNIFLQIWHMFIHFEQIFIYSTCHGFYSVLDTRGTAVSLDNSSGRLEFTF